MRNPDGRPVHLATIDKCLIGRVRPAPKRCDCVLFDDLDVRFIEFKLRAKGQANADDQNQETRLIQAGNQLLAGIQQFGQDGIIGPHHQVRAYAFVGYGPLFPAPTTTLTNSAEYINDSIRYFVDFDTKDSAVF